MSKIQRMLYAVYTHQEIPADSGVFVICARFENVAYAKPKYKTGAEEL